jgi:hypothetical protein
MHGELGEEPLAADDHRVGEGYRHVLVGQVVPEPTCSGGRRWRTRCLATSSSTPASITTGGAPCLDIYEGPLNTPIDVFHCGGGNLSQEWVIA